MDTHSSRPSCSSILFRSLATLFVHYTALVAVLSVYGRVLPGFQDCFEYLGLELPRVTRLITKPFT